MEEKLISKQQQKGIAIIMTLVFLMGSFFLAKQTAQYVNTMALSKRNVYVVIDPGHGGVDPGKVGINGALEKDINLSISLMLKEFLEASDVNVIMTRESDVGLYSEDDTNKKVADLKERVELIDASASLIAVSIHQNSYSEEYVHGAQVFYYDGSEAGQLLASNIQESIKNTIDEDNTREIKANDTYYLLTETQTPIVIVECGFLSNAEEADLLCEAWYQEKMAWSIHMGIIEYLNTATQ